MKTIILYFGLFLMGITNLMAQIYLPLEGFETGGKPTGWDQQVSLTNPRNWDYQNGGYTTDVIRHPTSAHSGNYNALFQAQSSTHFSTKLITPPINLIGSKKPVLNFWHAQLEWNGTDNLKIYYSITSGTSWVQIEPSFNLPTNNIENNNWVEREVLLPDAAKVANCLIAFEGITNWGWGVCIDDVQVVDRAILPRYVDGIVFKQNSTPLPSGSKINPLGYTLIKVLGNDGNIPINDMSIHYSGTDLLNLDQFKLYYTSDTVFTINSIIPSNITINNNDITLSPLIPLNLSTGNNYLWICADIKSNAAHGNFVDYTILSNSINIGGHLFPSTDQSPSGGSTVEKSLFFDDFETPNDSWILNGDWAIGTPLGSPTNPTDPYHSYDGTKVLGTNLAGNYSSNISVSLPHNAITKYAIDAKYYQNINLRYKRYLNVDYFDKAKIKVSNDDGFSWTTIMENFQTSINDTYWRPISNNISNQATRKSSVRVLFAMDETNGYTEYGGWNVDNFAITGDYISSDVGVKAMTSPLPFCGSGADKEIKVIVKNYGGQPVSTDFEVGYSLDNGTTYTKEWFTPTINSEQEIEYTFSTHTDLSVPGLKNLMFKTFLVGDEDTKNDAFSKQFYIYPKISTFPYTASFETSTDDWYGFGTNSTLAWGAPAKTTIHTASDGTKAWVTSLASHYKNNELSYLESPCFDLHTAQYPVLAFDYLLQTETGADGFAIEYSNDGGLSWLPLTAHVGYAANWYDTPTVSALGTAGWSINKTSYTTAKTLLPNDAKVDGFKVRFVFASNSTTFYEGVSIDRIKLYELPYNLGITALNSPVSACEIGAAVKVGLKIKNLGYRPIPIGTAIPIGIKVDQNTVVNESYTTAGILAQNATINYLSTNNYNFFAAGTHTVKASTNMAIDDDRSNDTLKTSNQVLVKGMPGFSLGADIGTTTPGSITLNAGSGYSYFWRKRIDTGAWTDAGTTQTHSVLSDLPIVDSALYSIQITNGIPCVANDQIKILISDKNVGVSAISNITTACSHASPIQPQVTIKNFEVSTFDGTEKIPLAVMVDGIIVLEENYTPTAGWGGVNTTFNYTFTGTINLAQAKTYDVRIFTKLGKDLNKSNDTTKVSVKTWGAPSVSLGVRTGNGKSITLDTISTAKADTLRFGVPNIYNPTKYLWERKRDGATSWSSLGITIDSLKLQSLSYANNSAYYRIKVEDVNGCGIARDSIYVNAKDLGILSIISPSGPVCYNPKGIVFSMDIKNFGQDDYPAGTPIAATCITPVGVQNVNINLSGNLTSGNKITVNFPEPVKLSTGDNFIRFSTAIDGDPNPSNDFKEMLLNVKQAPDVNIPIDTLKRTFATTDKYTISPIYSNDCKTYLWQDGTTTDSLFTFYGAPLINKYIVVATNDLGCTGSDSLVIATTDISISEIKSPANTCQLASGTAVTFTLTNSGNTDIPLGTKVDVNLNVNGTNKGTQQITLDALAVGASVDKTLSGVIDLSGMSNATVQIVATLIGLKDVNPDNNIKNKSVYSTGNPVISLGPDRVVHAWQEVLQPGNQFNTYLWQDNSTNATFTATTNGTYSVTVTDFYNCVGSDAVALTFVVDDLALMSIDSPTSACDLTNTETIKVTIKNTGTWTIPSGTTINIKYKVDGGATVSQTYTFGSNFAPNATLQVNLDNKLNLLVRKTYSLNVWVELTNDMVAANNSITKSIEAYPDVTVDLGPDIVHPGSITLDPGVYYSYLWNTGATTRTIEVTGSSEYWVEVANTKGCKDKDYIQVTYQVPDIQAKEINTSLNDCNNTSTEVVGLTIKNVGAWTFGIGNTINMRIKENGIQIANELLTLTDAFAPNETTYFEYATKVDLSTAGDHKFEVFFNNPLDKNQTNDTIKNTVSTFVVSLGADQTICENQTTTLDAGNPGATYSWSDGTNTIGTNQTITIGAAGTYTVAVTKNGCTISDAITITVTPVPVVNLGLNRVICNGTPQTLDAGNVGATYSWSDGTSTLGTNQTLVVSTTGNYRATVTKNGCSAYDEVLVSFEASPTINLGGNQNLCIGSSLELDGGEAYTGWTWSNAATTRKITINSGGTYTVTATNSNGCVGTGSATITIVPLPVVDLGADKAICTGQSTTLDAGNPSSTYLWSTSATTQTIQASTAGTYSVEVTNSNGCKNTDAITVSVNSLPVVTHSALASTCLDVTSITLSGGNPPGGSYSGLGVSGSTFTPTTAGAGTHALTYLYTDGNGCSNTTTVNITVNSSPIVNLGTDQTITEPLTLDAHNPGATYSWSNGTTIIGTSQTLVVSTTGIYSVTVTDGNGCKGSDAIDITWKNVADVQITALISPKNNCYNSKGQTVTAKLTNMGSKTYTAGENIKVWYQVNSSTPVEETLNFTSPFANGDNWNYTFTQKVLLNPGAATMVLKTIIGGVSGVLSTTYPITINASPTVDLGADTIKRSDAFVLTSSASSGVTYLWNTGSTNPSISLPASAWGKYWLKVTSIATGCTAKDSVVVHWPVNVETIPGSNAKITLFPNPVNDELTIKIETDKNEAFSINLVSPSGQIVKNLKTEKTLFFNDKIDVKGYTPGLYMIRISNDKGSAVFKVIIQR